MSTFTAASSRSAENPANEFGYGAAAACAVSQEASPRQVERWLQSGEAVLIDVREQDEHAREHIAGSRLVPLSRFGTLEVRSLTKPGQRIVLHCKSGRRSADAARMAISLAADGSDSDGTSSLPTVASFVAPPLAFTGGSLGFYRTQATNTGTAVNTDGVLVFLAAGP